MTRYQLINPSRASELVATLKRHYLEGDELNESQKDELKAFLSIVESDMTIDEGNENTLNDYLTDDYLGLSEVIFLILGLSPKLIEQYYDETLCNMIINEHTGDSHSKDPLITTIVQTRECRKLFKAPSTIKKGALRLPENKFMTERLIAWLLDKNLIKASDENPNESLTYNAFARKHNMMIAYRLVENKKEKVSNRGRLDILEKHYSEIKPELMTIFKNSTNKPSPKALLNYLQNYYTTLKKFKD